MLDALGDPLQADPVARAGPRPGGAARGRPVRPRGSGLPCGQVVGLPSRTTSRSSTSSEMTCSHRPASRWALSQSSPMMSTSRRSASRCLRTTPSARARALRRSWRSGARLRTMRSSASRRSSISDTEGAALSEPLGQAGLDDRDALFLEGEDGLEVLLDRGMEAVKHDGRSYGTGAAIGSARPPRPAGEFVPGSTVEPWTDSPEPVDDRGDRDHPAGPGASRGPAAGAGDRDRRPAADTAAGRRGRPRTGTPTALTPRTGTPTVRTETARMAGRDPLRFNKWTEALGHRRRHDRHRHGPATGARATPTGAGLHDRGIGGARGPRPSDRSAVRSGQSGGHRGHHSPATAHGSEPRTHSTPPVSRPARRPGGPGPRRPTCQAAPSTTRTTPAP